MPEGEREREKRWRKAQREEKRKVSNVACCEEGIQRGKVKRFR